MTRKIPHLIRESRGRRAAPASKSRPAMVRAGATFTAVAIAAVTIVTLAATLAGCGGAPKPKVVLIGIDGMDWALADPLMEEGRMPNLKRLLDEGMRADLHSLLPLEKSPTIWSTISSGKGPHKHGIGDFLDEEGNAPLLNSTSWKSRMIWEILGDLGYTVGVINWLVSWPAMEVNGYYVTDRIVYSPEDYPAEEGYKPVPHLTHPPELEQELAPLRQSYVATTLDDIADVMNGDKWREGEEVAGFAWGGVQTIRTIHAQDRTVLNVTDHLLDSREQPDFFAVYFLGLDRVCHRFWGQMRPWTVDMRMTDEFIEAFERVVPAYYERVDAYIGAVLEHIDPGSTVIVCSDHGFKGPKRTKDGLKLGIDMHREIGVLAAAGPGIRKGARPEGPSVLDITPTILALLGEPIGRDMDGFVIESMIDETYLSRHPVTFIDTYETGEERTMPEVQVDTPLDEDIKEELRSLGYID